MGVVIKNILCENCEGDNCSFDIQINPNKSSHFNVSTNFDKDGKQVIIDQNSEIYFNVQDFLAKIDISDINFGVYCMNCQTTTDCTFIFENNDIVYYAKEAFIKAFL